MIEIEGLTKRYGHITALDNFSLSVNQGEIFGLLGANGAGKSTLIKILVGALRYDVGQVHIMGKDPSHQRRELRRKIGYMPQAPALYEDLSPRDNVRFFARAHELDHLEERIDDVIRFVDLEARQRDRVGGFSGGMKQRVSLACALVHQPEVLLLDEPSAGVDPKLREAFWGHFENLASQGATILVSTHQMDEVMHCDRAAVMRAGKVLACDTPIGLLSRGQTKVTIWHGEEAQTHVVADAAVQLPRLLGVDATRIDILQDTLEDVVLGLIEEV